MNDTKLYFKDHKDDLRVVVCGWNVAALHDQQQLAQMIFVNVSIKPKSVILGVVQGDMA